MTVNMGAHAIFWDSSIWDKGTAVPFRRQFLLFCIVACVFVFAQASPALAASPQTFYAHSENRGYEANDNKIDQAVPEPAAATYNYLFSAAGDYQIPGNNAAGGRYFTASWPSANMIAAGTWTFHTWIKTTGGSPTYYVKVFLNAGTTPIFTSSSAAVGTGWSETDTTGSAPSISMAAGDRLRFEYWAHLATLTANKTLYPTAYDDLLGTVTNPGNAFADDNSPASLQDGGSQLDVKGFDNTDLGTITGATLYVKYKGSGTIKNDGYDFAYALDGTTFTTFVNVRKTNPPAAYTTASVSLGTPTWSQIATLQVRCQLIRQGGNPDVFTIDWDTAYVVLAFSPRVSLRIDDNATPDTSTRVDTTVAMIVPTLGWFLFSVAIGSFLILSVKRGNLLLPKRGRG